MLEGISRCQDSCSKASIFWASKESVSEEWMAWKVTAQED